METTHLLEAEIEELQRKYWQCFNNWECEEDLEKIQWRIGELHYKLSVESSKAIEVGTSIDDELPILFFERKKTVGI
jgi:hypothetical protein